MLITTLARSTGSFCEDDSTKLAEFDDHRSCPATRVSLCSGTSYALHRANRAYGCRLQRLCCAYVPTEGKGRGGVIEIVDRVVLEETSATGKRRRRVELAGSVERRVIRIEQYSSTNVVSHCMSHYRSHITFTLIGRALHWRFPRLLRDPTPAHHPNIDCPNVRQIKKYSNYFF